MKVAPTFSLGQRSGKVQWIAAVLAAAMSLSALGVSVAVAEASSQPAATTQASDEQEMLRVPAKTDGSDRLSSGDGGGVFKDWVQTVLALALVIALILLLRWALKKIGPGGRLFAGGGAVDVLATTGLSAKQRLILVRLGERLLLLGSTPGGLRTLCEITDPDEASQLAARFAAAGAKPATSADADGPGKEGDR